MNTSNLTSKRLPQFIIALIVFSLARAPLQAVDDITVDSFDTAASVSQWGRWWGSALQEYEWDGGVDASGNPASGSLKISATFNLATYGSDNQFASLRSFAPVDASKYESLVMDILWDPTSPVRPFNDFGYLEPGFRNLDYSQNWLPGLTVTTNAGWKHIVLPINPDAPKITNVAGIVLKMWSGDSSWGQTGTARFWVDNIRLIGRPEGPVPPPTMGIEKATPGLRIFASASGVQYQRQNIRTVNPVYSWVGSPDPVTYSITIADYPRNPYNNFQTHLFLVPGTNVPTTATSPDYSEASAVFLNIGNNADGSGYAVFRYKTNQTNSVSMFYGSGAIASIGSPDIRGTWNLTFSPGGEISLSTPNGAYTNFTMPSEAVSYFNASTYAYFGVQPNAFTNIGQAVTFSHIQITGVNNPIDDAFANSTLDSTWQIVAEDPSGIAPMAADGFLWLRWTLPDNTYRLQVSDDVTSTSWSDYTPGAKQIGNYRRAAVLQSQLPATSSGNYFFRLLRNP